MAEDANPVNEVQPTVELKHFRIVNDDNVVLSPREFQSETEANDFISAEGLEGKAVEFLPYEATEGSDQEDIDAAQRTTTYDQELVTLARENGVNPDNFANEQDLETAVEARREEVAAAKQAEEDRELNLEERSTHEEAE